MNEETQTREKAPSTQELIAEMLAVIEAQRRRIRDLEESELRLREQDFTFLDTRIATERRALFDHLERLHALLSTSFGDIGHGNSPDVSDAALEGLKRLARSRIIAKLRPDLVSRNPQLEPAELGDSYEREL